MNASEQSATRLPIITIGGFLGSGKTTLVNVLLSQAGGRRLVVFVNDFGAINIDHSLVETVEQDRISLSNGCVCCSLNDDLIAAVAEFARSDIPPDAIVIEASGVADPRALDSSFELLETSGAARLDTRVYVLDAAGFGDFDYEDSEHIIDHAAASDLILLNKADLASSEKVNAIRRILGESAPYSGVVTTRHCNVSIELLFGDDGRRLSRGEKPARVIGHENHSREYEQWNCETDVLLDRRRFDDFVKLLPGHCLRAKGTVRFSEAPDSHFLFNLVGHHATLELIGIAGKQGQSQLVAIGRASQMSPQILDTAFREMLLQP